MSRLILLVCILSSILIKTGANAQTVIWSEDFETYTDGDTLAVDNNTVNPLLDWSYGPGSVVNKVFGTNPINGNLSFYHVNSRCT